MVFMISCILLSAGQSLRFGSPKALASINKKTVIEHLLNALLETTVDEIIVVLGADQERIKPFLLKHKKIIVVYNKDYKMGQTTSFQTGLRNTSPETKGILLLPVDVPAVKSNTLDMLAQAFLLQKPLILIPTFEGRRGHPPIFHPQLKGPLLALKSDEGVNMVYQSYPSSAIVFCPVNDKGVTLSFNTIEEFERVRQGMC